MSNRSSFRGPSNPRNISTRRLRRLREQAVVPCENCRHAAGMYKHHHFVRTESFLANVSDHGGGAFAGVDRIENDAFIPAKQKNGFVASLARNAIALVNEVVVVLDLGRLHSYIETEHLRGLV